MGLESSPPIDRLSDLPNCLMENILTRLPLRDAVRTSILSTKWRGRWLLLTHLKFDGSFRSTFFKDKILSEAKLLKTIYQVLIAHSDHPIQKISLCFTDLKSCSEIELIAQHLSKINIQMISLSFSFNNDTRLSSHIFSCVNLKCLDLSYCVCVPPPSFVGFSLLTVLLLDTVCFEDYDFGTFLSKCPFLVELRMERCDVFPSLEIDCLNLTLFYWNGDFVPLIFKRPTVITSFTLLFERSWYSGQYLEHKDVEFFSYLPLMEKFITEYRVVRALAGIIESKRMKLTPLNNLKYLEISLILCVGDVEDFLHLIGICSNLRNLNIKYWMDYDYFGVEQENIDDVFVNLDLSEAAFDQLREVKLKMPCFLGRRPEIEFVRIILEGSPLLRKLHIDPEMSTTEEDLNSEMISTEEYLNSLKEVARLEPASPTCEIIFSCNSL